MVIFKTLIKDIINQNKNGTGSYSFTKTNYSAGKCGKGHNLSGHITQGNATYDAARKNMGEPWMMPTEEQARELINNTTNEWTSINEVNGRKFISNTDTSKHIFLPATGYYYEANHRVEGSGGHYWSITINTTPSSIPGHNTYDYARLLSFTSSSLGIATQAERSNGSSIHGIRPLEW